MRLVLLNLLMRLVLLNLNEIGANKPVHETVSIKPTMILVLY